MLPDWPIHQSSFLNDSSGTNLERGFVRGSLRQVSPGELRGQLAFWGFPVMNEVKLD